MVFHHARVLLSGIQADDGSTAPHVLANRVNRMLDSRHKRAGMTGSAPPFGFWRGLR
jgi:hypothetical protein